MKNTLTALAAFLFLIGGAVAARAQAVPVPAPQIRTVQELVLNDGSRIYGVVESESESEVVFRATSGALLTTARERIVSLRPVTGRIVRGEFHRDDPNDTRLLFGPTGRAVPKGQVYLGVYQILMPFVQVGVTDRFSIGGGTPLIFNIDDLDRLYWITPKLQLFSGNGTHAAVGLYHSFVGRDGAGIAYGVVTKDVGSGSLTAGAGLAYSTAGDRGGVFMVGGEAPVKRNINVVTENYFWGSTAVTSGGFRFFGEHLSADVGVALMFPDGEAFAFPVVNFVYRF